MWCNDVSTDRVPYAPAQLLGPAAICYIVASNKRSGNKPIINRGMKHAGGLRHHRRGLGRLRAGQPADRGSRNQSLADRGGRARLEPAYSRSGRLLQDARPPDPDLEIPRRARSRHQRPRHRLYAGQGDRRLLVDQRADLYPRPTRGLRPLGAARQSRLVVGRLPAVLPQGRALGGRRQRGARQGRAAVHLEDRTGRRSAQR